MISQKRGRVVKEVTKKDLEEARNRDRIELEGLILDALCDVVRDNTKMIQKLKNIYNLLNKDTSNEI